MRLALIVVAAGSGSRAQQALPKQYQPLTGVPMLRRTVQALAPLNAGFTVCVIAPEHEQYYNALSLDVPYIFGGATRSLSCKAGLEACRAYAPTHVAIHDAARPFVSVALLQRLRAAADDTAGVVPSIPIYDTLRRAGHTIDRSNMRAVQTPQLFPYEALCTAYAADTLNAFQGGGDDAEIFMRYGGIIVNILGDIHNRKFTDPEDFRSMPNMAFTTDIRVGHGIDVHPFDPNKTQLMLGGIPIEHVGLRGHSDADALLHALTDAVLGAAGADDIGTHFPPSDPRWAGADSRVFLRHALQLLANAGGRLMHVDLNVLCESPKIAPVRAEIRASIAALCALAPERVNLKAGTTEALGFLGRREGLLCTATVTAQFFT